jgi:hypothetical protein
MPGRPRQLTFEQLSCKEVRDRIAGYVRVDAASGCHVWTGPADQNGYAMMSVLDRHRRVSRMVLATKLGRVLLAKECALHACDNPPCVNPEHLFAGTRADNSLDMRRKGRSPRGERQGNAKLSEADVSAILESTASNRSLAERFGVTAGQISTIRAGKRWPHVSRPSEFFELNEARKAANLRRGARINTAKLTEEIVKEILSSPLKSSELALQLGVPASCIRTVRRGGSWAHVERPAGYDELQAARKRGSWDRGSGARLRRLLSDDDVRSIRGSKETTVSLAQRFGICRDTASLIRKRRILADVPDESHDHRRSV